MLLAPDFVAQASYEISVLGEFQNGIRQCPELIDMLVNVVLLTDALQKSLLPYITLFTPSSDIHVWQRYAQMNLPEVGWYFL